MGYTINQTVASAGSTTGLGTITLPALTVTAVGDKIRVLVHASIGAFTGGFITFADTQGLTYTPKAVAGIGGPTLLTLTLASNPWTPGGSSSASATALTLSTTYGGSTGTLLLQFSDGEFRIASVTNGSATVTWSTALTGTPTTTVSYSTGTGLFIYDAVSTATGSNTIVLTDSSTRLRSALAQDISGLVTSNGFQASAWQAVNNLGSQPTNLPFNSVTTTGQALFWAASIDVSNNYQAGVGSAAPVLTIGSTYWSSGNESTTAYATAAAGTYTPGFATTNSNQYDNLASILICDLIYIPTPNTALEEINVGTTPADKTGDPARVGGTKINDTIVTLYSVLGDRPTTPGCFGVSSAAGTTTTMTDATQTWATNQFAGQYVTFTTGLAPTVSGGTTTPNSNLAYSSLIASNTSTVLTFAALGFATTAGVGYDISPVVTTAQTDGQATSVGGTGPITLIDATKSWTTAQWAGYQVTFLGGIYAGKSLPISSNTATTLSLGSFFTTAIAAGTPYIIGTRTGTNYVTLTAGTTYSIGNGAGIVSINGPTSMTLTTPQHPIDGDVVRIVNNYTSTITTFSVVGYTGQTAPTVPSTLTAQQGIAIWYDAASTTWYRLS